MLAAFLQGATPGLEESCISHLDVLILNKKPCLTPGSRLLSVSLDLNTHLQQVVIALCNSNSYLSGPQQNPFVSWLMNLCVGGAPQDWGCRPSLGLFCSLLQSRSKQGHH